MSVTMHGERNPSTPAANASTRVTSCMNARGSPPGQLPERGHQFLLACRAEARLDQRAALRDHRPVRLIPEPVQPRHPAGAVIAIWKGQAVSPHELHALLSRGLQADPNEPHAAIFPGLGGTLPHGGV